VFWAWAWGSGQLQSAALIALWVDLRPQPTSDLRLPFQAAPPQPPPFWKLIHCRPAHVPPTPCPWLDSLATCSSCGPFGIFYESCCSSGKQLKKSQKKPRRTIKNSFRCCFGLCKDGRARIAQDTQGQPVGIDGLFQQFEQICPVKQKAKVFFLVF